MPDDTDDQTNEPGTDPIDDAIDATTTDPAAAAIALTPEAIRNSPEFKALEKANRTLRRTNGQVERAAATARTAAEEARQAAEAQQQAALEADLTATLGDEGIALWSEIAELSTTDQRAAAQRLAEALRTAGAQNAAATEDDDDADPASAGGTTVPATTPPPPSRGASGAAPLNAVADDSPAQVIEALEKEYNSIVDRVQDPTLRNRVTQKVRNAGFIAYLAAGYLKGGATPRTPRT